MYHGKLSRGQPIFTVIYATHQFCPPDISMNEREQNVELKDKCGSGRVGGI